MCKHTVVLRYYLFYIQRTILVLMKMVQSRAGSAIPSSTAQKLNDAETSYFHRLVSTPSYNLLFGMHGLSKKRLK